MSSFLNRGKREAVRLEKKEIKKRTKDFYKILGELEDVANRLDRDYSVEKVDVITEDNIVEIASDYTDRTIGDFEKFILLGKLEQLGFEGLRATRNEEVVEEVNIKEEEE